MADENVSRGWTSAPGFCLLPQLPWSLKAFCFVLKQMPRVPKTEDFLKLTKLSMNFLQLYIIEPMVFVLQENTLKHTLVSNVKVIFIVCERRWCWRSSGRQWHHTSTAEWGWTRDGCKLWTPWCWLRERRRIN